MRHQIICVQCGKKGPHAARGLCNRCYKAQPEIAERGREQALAWYHDHADEANARQAEYRRTSEGNKKRNDRLRKTYATNSESRYKTIHRVLRRQDMKRGAVGSHTFMEWSGRLKEYNNHCAYCLKPLSKLTRDHMIPISENGNNTIDNIVPSCIGCNTSKGAKTLLQFILRTRGVF